MINDHGDQILTVTDAADDGDGVRITAAPSARGQEPAIVTVCAGAAVIALDAGDDVIVTCGSVTIEVLAGRVEVTFVAENGTQATASLGEGNALTFDEEAFTFDAPATNTGTISIDVGGDQISVSSGEHVDARAVIESRSPVITPAPAVEEPTPETTEETPSLDEGSSRGPIAAVVLVLIVAVGIVGGAAYTYIQKSKG